MKTQKSVGDTFKEILWGSKVPLTPDELADKQASERKEQIAKYDEQNARLKAKLNWLTQETRDTWQAYIISKQERAALALSEFHEGKVPTEHIMDEAAHEFKDIARMVNGKEPAEHKSKFAVKEKAVPLETFEVLAE